MSQIKINNPADLAKFLKTPAIREIESKTGVKARRHKYRAVRTEYDGLFYDSKSEAAYAEWLGGEVKSGGVLWWVRAPSFHLGCPENVYRPDFLVVVPMEVWNEGTKTVLCDVHVVDVKGRETAKFRKDKRLWAAYGPCPLRIAMLDLHYPSGVSKLEAKPEIVGINYEVIDPK